jgi:hypothetical protein
LIGYSSPLPLAPPIRGRGRTPYCSLPLDRGKVRVGVKGGHPSRLILLTGYKWYVDCTSTFKYYLGKETNVLTYLCINDPERTYVPVNLDQRIVKPTTPIIEGAGE